MSWCKKEGQQCARIMDSYYLKPLDPHIWQELPSLLVALIISKLPIMKLIEVVQHCRRFIKNQVMDSPPQLLQEHRSVECLFPIFATSESGRMSAFGVKSQSWKPMPGLDFLPHDVKHVLAGSGGLMCVTSSQYQYRWREKTTQAQEILSARKSIQPQPVIVICNSLTRKTRVLPPMPSALRFAVAHLKIRTRASNYALYLAGWDEEANAMVVTVFTSKAQAWVGWRSLPNDLRPISSAFPGAVSCAVLQNEMWLAAENRWAGYWRPRITGFDFNTQSWKYVLHWLSNYEAPRLVQADDCLYVVSTFSEKPFSLHIFEVVGACERECPYSNFEEVAQMPCNVHRKFFDVVVRKPRPCQIRWKCRADNGFIFFYNTESGGLVWYNIGAVMDVPSIEHTCPIDCVDTEPNERATSTDVTRLQRREGQTWQRGQRIKENRKECVTQFAPQELPLPGFGPRWHSRFDNSVQVFGAVRNRIEVALPHFIHVLLASECAGITSTSRSKSVKRFDAMLIANVSSSYVVSFGGDWSLSEDGVTTAGLRNLCSTSSKRASMANERSLLPEFVSVASDGDANLCGMSRFGGVMSTASVCGKKVAGAIEGVLTCFYGVVVAQTAGSQSKWLIGTVPKSQTQALATYSNGYSLGMIRTWYGVVCEPMALFIKFSECHVLEERSHFILGSFVQFQVQGCWEAHIPIDFCQFIFSPLPSH
uniref:F-box domain-containing protein n=1 Tax=Physcomitrium patens TaxID=3218 RepID=A0A2K1J6U8_PHYPA|nr:hypothetical protein PHYPA_020350 [Physcomitrium patens]